MLEVPLLYCNGASLTGCALRSKAFLTRFAARLAFWTACTGGKTPVFLITSTVLAAASS